jgi:BON domain-containing protein
MNSLTAMVTGAGLGCLAMYGLDPEMGRRRRSLARDKMSKIQRKAGEAAAFTARDLRNRTLGTLAEGRSLFTEKHVPDADLAERVRSELGFLVRYPSFTDVQVHDGVVILSGHAFSDECEQLIEGVRSIRGVRDVEKRVEAHQGTEDFPGLRGQPLKAKPTGRPFDIMQQHWSPATSFIVGFVALVGLGALAYSFADSNGRSRRRFLGAMSRFRSQRSRGMIGNLWPHRSHGLIGKIREELRL